MSSLRSMPFKGIDACGRGDWPRRGPPALSRQAPRTRPVRKVIGGLIPAAERADSWPGGDAQDSEIRMTAHVPAKWVPVRRPEHAPRMTTLRRLAGLTFALLLVTTARAQSPT